MICTDYIVGRGHDPAEQVLMITSVMVMNGVAFLHRIRPVDICNVVGGVMTPPYSNQ